MSFPLGQLRGYRFGPFEVDLQACELRKHGRKIRLQEKPFRVLAALLEQDGRLVSREELRQRLWPTDTFVDFDNGLNTAVSKLREALGDRREKRRYIETVGRRGYRFLPTAESCGGPVTPQVREFNSDKNRIEPDAILIGVAGKFMEGSGCQQIERLILYLLSQGQKKFIFDLSLIDRLDSTGVGVLVTCSGAIKRAGGALHLAGARTSVETVLEVSEVTKLMPLYQSTLDALNGFTGKAA